MINPMNLFAASESGPSIHVAPEALFTVAGFDITNSILYGWLASLLIIALLVSVARRVTVRPAGGVVQFIELGTEFVRNLVVNSFNDKKVGVKYVPFFVTVFFFVLLTNWLGLAPGVGDAFAVGDTPLLRAFTADLNGTLAIGIFVMAMVYVASVKEMGGIRKYFGHFFIGSPLNPLYLVIGLLEMVTDLTRVFSLSLRLFLNVAIGEIIIAVFTFLGGAVAPVAALPFTLIELFVGALQAYIFTVLGLMYLSISVNHAGHDEHDHGDETLTEETVPETIGLRSGNTQRA